MNKLKRIRRGRGFTLVEISVGLVVLLVLIVVSSSIMLVSGNIFIRNAVINDNSIIAGEVCGYIADKLSCAKYITVTSSQTIDAGFSADYVEQLALTGGGTVFSLSRPSVSAAVSDIYTDEELGERAISVTLAYDAAGYVTVTVMLFNGGLNGEKLCEISRVSPLLNKNAEFFSEPFMASSYNTDYQNLYITYSYLD